MPPAIGRGCAGGEALTCSALTAAATSGIMPCRLSLCTKELSNMFWLKLVEVVLILIVGIYAIAFVEDKVVSAPRRRVLERKARERLQGKQAGE